MTDYLSVSALTKYIKYKFDQDPHLQTILIKGELSNFKKHTSGHLYFNVKDDNSVINATMFRGNASKLGFTPKEGDEVLIEARVSVFEKRGNYQLYVNKMQLDGIGILYQRLAELKEKLRKEGLFDDVNKKPIPQFPSSIAILTASTGAAIRDIYSTLNSRYPLVKQEYISTLVQGKQAKDDIVAKIEQADQLGVDVIILGRGGGSIEDLWNFNEEEVARAIYNCKTPIISAVGHESDYTISDLVADVRAATPTHAAVLATPDQFELMQQLKQVQLSMTRQIQQIIKQQRKRLDYLASYYKFKTPSLLYDQQIQRRDELEKQLNLNLKMQLTQARQDLRLVSQKFNLRYLLNDIKQYQSHVARYQQVLVQRLRQMLSHNETQLKNKVELLNNLSPTNVMLRGYSIISKDDQVVTSVDQISKGDQLNLAMKDGNIKASVEKVGKNDE